MAFRIQMLPVDGGDPGIIGGSQERAASFFCDFRVNPLQCSAGPDRPAAERRILFRLPDIRRKQKRGDDQDSCQRDQRRKADQAPVQTAADLFR